MNAASAIGGTMALRVPIESVEDELRRQTRALPNPGNTPIQQARMSNLVICCDNHESAASTNLLIPAVIGLHPARVLLLSVEPDTGASAVEAEVLVRASKTASGRTICSEQISLRVKAPALGRLPFAVREFLVGDLPLNVWWTPTSPPPLAGSIFHDLTERAQQLIYDSQGWREPHRGVAGTSAWLNKFEFTGIGAAWRVASDLNWRRLKFWRRLLTQALDPALAPGALDSITEVLVEHGPHAVTQAWQIVGWLASRLGWRIEAARVQPGLEMCWQVSVKHAHFFRLRIRRLADGPSELQSIRIGWRLAAKSVALEFRADDNRRLSVTLEGEDAMPRTVMVQTPSIAEMVGRQLSDRAPDPVFSQSMAVAQVFAKSVLGEIDD